MVLLSDIEKNIKKRELMTDMIILKKIILTSNKIQVLRCVGVHATRVNGPQARLELRPHEIVAPPVTLLSLIFSLFKPLLLSRLSLAIH